MASLVGSCFVWCSPDSPLQSALHCLVFISLHHPCVFILLSSISLPTCIGCCTPICSPHLSFVSLHTVFPCRALCTHCGSPQRMKDICFICVTHVTGDSILCSCTGIWYWNTVLEGCQPLCRGWGHRVHSGGLALSGSLISAAICGLTVLFSGIVSGHNLIFVFAVSVFALLISLAGGDGILYVYRENLLQPGSPRQGYCDRWHPFKPNSTMLDSFEERDFWFSIQALHK